MEKQTYKISPNAYSKTTFGKQAVTVIGEKSVELFELVGSAQDIWQILENGATLEELFAELREDWDEFGEAQEQEVVSFLQELVEKELVVVSKD